MSLKMRSIFAQVYQKSVSVGRSRNFFSSSTNCEVSKKIDIGIYAVNRTIGFASGFLFGYYILGDLDKFLEEELEEDLRKDKEYFKRSEEMWVRLAKYPWSSN